jgi:Ca-activated chloride channel family protein
MRFESPWLLLLLIPVLAVTAWGLLRAIRRPAALRLPTLASVLLARPSWTSRLAGLPLGLQAVAAILAVVAIARPQLEEADALTGEGADFVIALDMSGSMNAVDMPAERILEYHRKGTEPPNRFVSAREVLKDFIRSRPEDRIGLVIFSGKAFVKFPLTLDRDAMLRILDGLVLDDRTRMSGGEESCTNGCSITGEATAIGDALGRAYKRLEDSQSKSRNILLITDGDNNAGKAAPEELARFIGQQSVDRPVHAWTFLVGTGRETFLPANHQFTGRPLYTPEGHRVYERPEQPFPVNPDLLRLIASATGGRAFEAATEDDFRKEFENLQTTEFAAPALHRWREAFLPPLVASLALFLLGQILGLTVLRRWP